MGSRREPRRPPEALSWVSGLTAGALGAPGPGIPGRGAPGAQPPWGSSGGPEGPRVPRTQPQFPEPPGGSKDPWARVWARLLWVRLLRAGGPLGAPRTLESWAPLGARASIGPRRIRRAPGGPRGTGDPQRPRGGGARKSTRGPLRAPRRPLGAWGLGALSFPPPGAQWLPGPYPAGSRAPRDPNP